MLSISIKARNSSGLQHLYIDTEEDGHFLTLVGRYKDEYMQIDFEPLTDKDIKDFINLLQSRLGEPTR